MRVDSVEVREATARLEQIFATVGDREPPTRDLPLSQLNFVICMGQRTGSTFLCALLKRAGLGAPDEYFNPRGSVQTCLEELPAHSLEDYVDLVRRHCTQDRGIFGFKTSFYDFQPFIGRCQQFFPDLRFLYLERQDVLAQAISAYKARHSDHWHAKTEQDVEVARSHDVPFDEGAIMATVDDILQERLYWNRFFALRGLSPLQLTYERVASAPATVVGEIAEYLGAEIVGDLELERSPYKKIGGDQNVEWANRIRARYPV